MKALKFVLPLLTSFLLVTYMNISVFAEEEKKDNNIWIIEPITFQKDSKVITKEDYEKFNEIINIKKSVSQEKVKVITSDVETLDLDAYKLALTYVGKTGSCFHIAELFIEEYFGESYSLASYEVISIEDAIAGDVIYYYNGGLGCQHYAIYLGGNLALQGNYNGSAVIGEIYLKNASSPEIRRLKK